MPRTARSCCLGEIPPYACIERPALLSVAAPGSQDSCSFLESLGIPPHLRAFCSLFLDWRLETDMEVTVNGILARFG